MNVANQGAMAGRRTTTSARVSQVRSRRVDFEGETVPVKWHVLCRSPFFSRRLLAAGICDSRIDSSRKATAILVHFCQDKLSFGLLAAIIRASSLPENRSARLVERRHRYWAPARLSSAASCFCVPRSDVSELKRCTTCTIVRARIWCKCARFGSIQCYM